MRVRLMVATGAIAILAVVATGCGRIGGGGAGPAGGDGSAVEGSAEASSPAEASGGAPSQAAAPSGGEVTGDAPGQEDGGANALPTADATQQAVAADFSFPRKGPESPAMMIYEFADYRCPYCRRFATDVLPQLEEDFMGEDGQVAMAFVDFPLSVHGFPAVVAAEAAHCAGEQDAYWDMHNTIFGHFADMNDLPLDDDGPSMEMMIGFGDDLGLDTDALRVCLETQRYRPTIGTIYRDARDAQVDVTPTLIVGQQVVRGLLSYEQLKPIVERQLAMALGTPVAAATPIPGTPEGSSDR